MLVRVDARDLRVGDADRERVATLLQQAVGAGMLTLDEFSDRMDAAMVARTRGQLDTVLADLPIAGPRGAEQPVPSASAAAVPIETTMSSIRRAGHWRVPQHMRVKNRLSSVVLDLTQAEIHTPVVVFDMDDICGSTDILLPEDFTADINDLHCLGSSATSKVRTGPPSGRVHVVVRGKIRFGSLTVKHPLSARLRRFLG